MNEENRRFVALLPEELADVTIPEGKKAAETIRWIRGVCWIVHLTEMGGKRSRAWSVDAVSWSYIEPKHGGKVRWVKDNISPRYESQEHPKAMKSRSGTNGQHQQKATSNRNRTNGHDQTPSQLELF